MDLQGLSEAEQTKWHMLMLQENREQTFTNWPFTGEDCQCTAKKMAEAGFYHCPTDQEPDAAQCWVCHKELDGWESTDDPLDEHRKHSRHCPFLSLRNPNDMTIGEAMEMSLQRFRMLVEKQTKLKMKELGDYADEAVKQMKNLL